MGDFRGIYRVQREKMARPNNTNVRVGFFGEM